MGLGQALASKKAWWGADPDEATANRTVISCIPTRNKTYNISVSNAIGAFGAGGTTFIVRPKIPMRHALFLLSRARAVPRLDDAPLRLAESTDFRDLIAQWFNDQASKVIARGLIRDYEVESGPLRAVRGRLQPIATAERYYAGSLELVCEYDEFTVDNALNRVLLASALILQRLFADRPDIRKRSRNIAMELAGAGTVRVDDFRARPDRRTAYYSNALSLARLICSSIALDLGAGGCRAWTFLIRTPEAIEEGIRRVLYEGMRPGVHVSKYGTSLLPRHMTVEPDLRLDPPGAVGDCKYKLHGKEWVRGDLYQSVAFAAGTRAAKSCVVSFSDRAEARPLGDIRFGDITVSHLLWDASPGRAPELAADELVQQCKEWLGANELRWVGQ